MEKCSVCGWIHHSDGWCFERLVRTERERQDAKWGEQNHNATTFVSILGEEYGSFCKAVNNMDMGEGSTEEILTELIHVAAVAKAIYESGVRNGWL